MLDSGDVNQILDRPQFSGLGDSVFDVAIIGQIRFDEDHLAPHIPSHFLGFLSLLLVYVQPNGHQFVGSRRYRRRPTDSRTNSCYNAYMIGNKIVILQD